MCLVMSLEVLLCQTSRFWRPEWRVARSALVGAAGVVRGCVAAGGGGGVWRASVICFSVLDEMLALFCRCRRVVSTRWGWSVAVELVVSISVSWEVSSPSLAMVLV